MRTFAAAKKGRRFGGLAQLARAPALHAGGQRFESVILHQVNNLYGYELTQDL